MNFTDVRTDGNANLNFGHATAFKYQISLEEEEEDIVTF